MRVVHGALWRELAEPIEFFRRFPWYLGHIFFIMALLAILYLAVQVFDWNEYEENGVRRAIRDIRRDGMMQQQGDTRDWRKGGQ